MHKEGSKQFWVTPFILQDKFFTQDVTEVAKTIVKGVQQLISDGRQAKNYTLLYILDVFKGGRGSC